MLTYDAFRHEVRRRKRARWLRILNSEAPGRVAGRRPRDPEQEALLLRLDRARLARGAGIGGGGAGAADPRPRGDG